MGSQDLDTHEFIRDIERQRERHAAVRSERLTPEEAIGTFRYLLEQTAAIDQALGRDPYDRWLDAKGRGRQAPPKRSDR